MKVYDVVFLGNYTKETIVSAAGTRIVDGGAFNYGAQVAARMGLDVAAITRLARQDSHVVYELAELGIDVFATATPQSTCLRLEYPTSDLDEHVILVTSTAGAFEVAEVRNVQARVFVIGASLRGEVSLEVIEELSKKDALLAADVQGFIRVSQDGLLDHAPWPGKRAVLSHVDVLKTDAVEAEMLTGEADIHAAARSLAKLGPGEVVITHRNGVLVYAEGTVHQADFVPKELVGRSGRGDTCLAAYVAQRLVSSAAEATVWAAAVTSLKMEAEGPFRRNIHEIQDLIQQSYAQS
jgi:sugar/nucleoside kinase (ribokinase family)